MIRAVASHLQCAKRHHSIPYSILSCTQRRNLCAEPRRQSQPQEPETAAFEIIVHFPTLEPPQNQTKNRTYDPNWMKESNQHVLFEFFGRKEQLVFLVLPKEIRRRFFLFFCVVCAPSNRWTVSEISNFAHCLLGYRRVY